MTVEALVNGRVLMDLYPEQAERPLEEVTSFRSYAGGFATNVATGLARLGVDTAVFSAVGDDGPGRRVRRFLEAEGIDTTALGTHPTLRTALAFCEIWPPDDFPVTFYREPTCPDWEVRADDVDMALVRRVPLLYVSGTALAREPSREAAVAMVEARSGGEGATVLDLDWRPMLWDAPADFARAVAGVIDGATDVLGGDAEWRAAGLDPRTDATHARRAAKHGPDGCTIYEADGSVEDRRGLRVPVTNGLGAGDAFAAGWGLALLRGLDPGDVANAAGALVATRHSCSEAMPTRAELDAFLATGEVPSDPDVVIPRPGA